MFICAGESLCGSSTLYSAVFANKHDVRNYSPRHTCTYNIGIGRSPALRSIRQQPTLSETQSSYACFRGHHTDAILI